MGIIVAIFIFKYITCETPPFVGPQQPVFASVDQISLMAPIFEVQSD